jgi:DNA-binding transcriptional LysR family regulator
VLRLDLHGTHATRIVLPHIDAFRARYAGIELVVSSGDRLVDLVREGVDREANPVEISRIQNTPHAVKTYLR